MRWSRLILVLLTAGLAAAAPLLAVFEPTPEELEQNRQKVAFLKKNDKDYANLLHGLAEFLALPREERDRLRRLDHDLHQEPPSTQTRLFNVMERYADWLERLPPRERQEIRAARTGPERLAVIRRLRFNQWLARLPRATREEMGRLSGEKKEQYIAALKKQERDQRTEWALAFRDWDERLRKRPAINPEQLPERVKVYVSEYLLPRLSAEEQARLDRARKNKPAQFGKTLVELADRYPMALPGVRGPTRFAELPREVQKMLPMLRTPPPHFPRIKEAEGRWPLYGTVVAGVALKAGKELPTEFLPTRYKDLSHEVRLFLDGQLVAMLSPEEHKQLDRAQGHWPGYPRAIEGLARKHHLEVPWQTLPGPREVWDRYRTRRKNASANLPDVPWTVLRTFAETKLTPEQRAALGLAFSDPASRELLKKLYFQRNPDQVQHWKQVEARRSGKKKKGRGKGKGK